MGNLPRLACKGHTYREGEGSVRSGKLRVQQAEIEAGLVMIVQVVKVWPVDSARAA